MRVTPWNQYQLVGLKADCDLQLASGKKRFFRRCASFICFRRPAARPERSAPPKVGPTKQHDILPRTPESTEENDQTHAISTVDDDIITNEIGIKSSLKKTTITISNGVNTENENLSNKDINVRGYTKKRKVWWADVYGGELVEIREFETRYDEFLVIF